MKNLSIAFSACVLAVLAGCAADATTQPEVGVSSEALTLAECGKQRDACIAKSGLLGLVTCNAQYTTCSATASNGVPAQVTDAAAAAAECTTDLDNCVAAATKPSELAQCAEDQASCVADALKVTLPTLDLSLPPVVSGAGDCADDATSCVAAAKTVSDVTGCGETLVDCATDVVAKGTAVGDVIDCADGLDACVAAASTPSALAKCGEEQAVCVAGALDVQLPDVPVSKVVDCTDAAADCAMGADTVSDVLDCASGLVDCGQAVAKSVPVPPAIDCNAQWNKCLLTNPFGFGKCADQLRVCLKQ
jgi:hypothetical protein